MGLWAKRLQDWGGREGIMEQEQGVGGEEEKAGLHGGSTLHRGWEDCPPGRPRTPVSRDSRCETLAPTMGRPRAASFLQGSQTAASPSREKGLPRTFFLKLAMPKERAPGHHPAPKQNSDKFRTWKYKRQKQYAESLSSFLVT